MRIAILIVAATGCWFQPNDSGGPPPAECSGVTSYEIDTGASLSYTPGVDAGYYLAYNGGGAWHFEWTCDTKLSAEGCNFTGAITAPTPTGGLNATCFQCEAEDELTVTPNGPTTEIDFNTITSTGIDGVDFATTAGSSVHIDLQIDGLYQNDLVFIPSGGAAANALCNPVDLAPSSP
ncbi:MAG TPA: hypothetical protein VMJ10_12720 [Kofleriaceae bacterium]|nr:hypothetical protein [Kofleriaceae bacterium]